VRTILSIIETGGPGGAETVCVQLLKGLDRPEWRGVAVIPYKGWLYDRLTEGQIETHVRKENRSFDLAFLSFLRGLVRRNNVDVIHGHLFGSSVRAGLLSRVTGVPAIGTLHGQSDLAPGERFLGLKRAILRRGLSRVVFVSEPLRQSFLERVKFPADRVVVIPNGIDPARFTAPRDPAFRASLGIAPDEFVVGAVGNMNAAKGFDVLLRAAAILKQTSPGIRFVVVGDDNGRRSAELKALRTELGLEHDVVFTGFRGDIPAALASFDLYTLTSRSEGFSISIIEAMATGLPVVATRCGGPEQILENERTGLLVENASHEAVAAGIARLRSDRARANEFGEAARIEVKERFTASAQARAYERVYEECIMERRHRTGARGLDRVDEIA
jgi:glycosyltransferase involved in cell wall biosynthesis